MLLPCATRCTTGNLVRLIGWWICGQWIDPLGFTVTVSASASSSSYLSSIIRLRQASLLVVCFFLRSVLAPSLLTAIATVRQFSCKTQAGMGAPHTWGKRTRWHGRIVNNELSLFVAGINIEKSAVNCGQECTPNARKRKRPIRFDQRPRAKTCV